MSSLEFERDNQMSHLESEWRQAYEAGNDARAELKACIMAKIERLEDSSPGRHS